MGGNTQVSTGDPNHQTRLCLCHVASGAEFIVATVQAKEGPIE